MTLAGKSGGCKHRLVTGADMHVNTDGFRSGASTSYSAADHAYEGANSLGRAGIGSSIFGDIPAATSFRDAVSGARNRHVKMIDSHSQRLGTVGDKAHHAAAEFADMEAQNRARLDAVDDSI